MSHNLCLVLVRVLTSLALIVESSLATNPFPFTHFHITLSSSLCVRLTITSCQANDRSCNRMSAFLDSVALFSVPTRQIAKKVKLTPTITKCKRVILHYKLTHFDVLTFINFPCHSNTSPFIKILFFCKLVWKLVEHWYLMFYCLGLSKDFRTKSVAEVLINVINTFLHSLFNLNHHLINHFNSLKIVSLILPELRTE